MPILIAETGKGDTILKVAKLTTGAVGTAASVITGIPGLSLAPNLLDLLVKSPIQKRILEFLEQVAKDIDRLKLEVSTLSENQLLVDVLLQSLQIAMRNSQLEKLEALRSAILNTATLQFTDSEVASMFLSWIDIFTPWHLRLLHETSKGEILFGIDDFEPEAIINQSLLEQTQTRFQGKFDPDLARQAYEDLRSRGLIKINLVSQTNMGEFPSKVTITPLGERFLKFTTTTDI